jgi:hypothetical protein
MDHLVDYATQSFRLHVRATVWLYVRKPVRKYFLAVRSIALAEPRGDIVIPGLRPLAFKGDGHVVRQVHDIRERGLAS